MTTQFDAYDLIHRRHHIRNLESIVALQSLGDFRRAAATAVTLEDRLCALDDFRHALHIARHSGFIARALGWKIP